MSRITPQLREIDRDSLTSQPKPKAAADAPREAAEGGLGGPEGADRSHIPTSAPTSGTQGVKSWAK